MTTTRTKSFGRTFWQTLGTVCAVWLLSVPKAEAGQLLFEVNSNKYPNMRYRFFTVTKGKHKRLTRLRYVRQTSATVAGRRSFTNDLCYPIDISIAAIRRGVAIMRNANPPAQPWRLRKLLKQKRAGRSLGAAQTRQLKRLTRRYCRRFRASKKGRFVTAIRGYGHRPEAPFDPAKGGTIVVTYLRNGVLNFFRGSYRYVVLQVRKHKGRWRLQTLRERDASRLYIKAYSLGVSQMERQVSGLRLSIPSHPCRRWINPKYGTCRLTPFQLKTDTMRLAGD